MLSELFIQSRKVEGPYFEAGGLKEIGVDERLAVGRGVRYLKANDQNTITHAMKIK
jgi:hypothetical protein